jgi:glycerate kinase
MPRFVLAPDKFKGSLSARGVAAAIELGLRDVLGEAIDVAIVPMADGGEGTVATFLESGARPIRVRVTGPQGRPTTATFAATETTAIVETASASGLALVPSGARDAKQTSTFGSGELIRAALDRGYRHLVIGIGGSATNDGGAGMLQALGASLRDENGTVLPPGGAALAALASIDLSGLDVRLREARIEVACDVDNPLLGPSGASAVYGPQKGATPADVALLDAALARYADVVADTIGIDHRDLAGAGAAGGLGFGLVAVLGARLRPGVDAIAEVRALDAVLAGARACITGEGRVDRQTLSGKVVAGVGAHARALGVPTYAVGGSIDAEVEPELWERGVVCVPIADRPRTLRVMVHECAPLVRAAAARLARTAFA